VKVFSFFSQSHKPIFLEFFKPSFFKADPKNLLSLNFAELPQRTEAGEYFSEGWSYAMLDKVRLILKIIRSNFGSFVVLSDADVQFFEGFAEDILSHRRDGVDILFQDDAPKPEHKNRMCTGFVLVKCNSTSEGFYEKILDLLPKYQDEQLAANTIADTISFDFLPNEKYYTISSATNNQIWGGQEDLEIPKSILMHHANWVRGIGNKVKLLNFVKKKMLA
jgi:hypothetical protein